MVTLLQFVFVAMLFKQPSGRNLLERSTADKLVVYNAVRGPNNLAYINHSRSTAFPQKEWDCIVYMYATESEVGDDDIHLRNLRDNHGCTVPRTPGVMWVTFLQFITPTLVANYDYIALVLDDVMIPNKGEYAVDTKKMIKKMKDHDIQVLTPGKKFCCVWCSGFVRSYCIINQMTNSFVSFEIRYCWGHPRLYPDC